MIDENEYKHAEEECRNKTMCTIQEIYSLINEMRNALIENGKVLGMENIQIPNIGITINNKIGELNQQFNAAGISFFVTKVENYDYVGMSVIGESIIYQFLDDVTLSRQKLEAYMTELEAIIQEKYPDLMNTHKVGVLKKIFYGIKSIIASDAESDCLLNQDEINVLEELLQQYRDIDEKIWKYKVDKDLVDSIIKAFTDKDDIEGYRYEPGVVPEILKNCVYPDLKKLGLAELIPSIQKGIIEKYVKDLNLNKANVQEVADCVNGFNVQVKVATPNDKQKNISQKRYDDEYDER